MIKSYLKYQWKVLFSIVFASILFGGFGFLVQVKQNDIFYGVFLYLFIMFLFLFYDFIKFTHRVKRLQEIKYNLGIHTQNIPLGDNRIEESYHEMVEGLYEIITQTLNQLESQKTETEEYYTLWIHQIKTPIAAMHLVLENMEEISQKAILELELFKIEQYVELALQFIKIGNIESDLVIREYPLKAMVLQSVKKYSLLFIQKGLGVDVEGCEESIITDEKWFTFLLEQILSNAVKYTQKGMIRIATKKDLDGIYLTIEDTGIGIKKEDIKRVFEKGYTGFNGRVDKKASGIGLYLAKQVASALNHQISIESELLKGTKVSIFIKCYQL